MKKTLMALAVGAAFVAPAAFADVTISGAINMGIAYVNSEDSDAGAGNTVTGAKATNPGTSNFQLTGNYSNITISSVDDLGGGLKLDFAAQMDWGGINGAGSTIANRNSHIGLVSESWGGIWYGTNENLYERYYYTVDPLDGAAGIGGNLQMMGTAGYGNVFDNGQDGCSTVSGCSGFYRRTDQTIWYDSPSFGGFTFGAYTTTSAFKSGAPGDTNPVVWGLGGKYVGAGLPIQAWVAYEEHDDMFGIEAIAGPNTTGASGSDDSGLQIGLGYTLGDIFIFANYEMLEYEGDGVTAGVSQYERDAFSVGVKWNLASGYVGAQYIQALEADCEAVGGGCNSDESDAWMIGLGYYHTLSKQTQAYIMGSYIDNGDNAAYVLAGAGTNNASTSWANGGPAFGAAHSALTIGLKHSF
jgi:predicted porin